MKDDAVSRQYPVVDHSYDAVVVGAGGAGNSFYKYNFLVIHHFVGLFVGLSNNLKEMKKK